MTPVFETIEAKSSLRAEAFLRAKKLWKDQIDLTQ
jgi:hypothetical protein